MYNFYIYFQYTLPMYTSYMYFLYTLFMYSSNIHFPYTVPILQTPCIVKPVYVQSSCTAHI